MAKSLELRFTKTVLLKCNASPFNRAARQRRHFSEHARNGAAAALMADQHQRLRIMGKLADGHIDEPSRPALEFDIERCEERDAVIQDGGMTHDLDGVRLNDGPQVDGGADEGGIEIGPDRAAGAGDHQRVVDAVAETDESGRRMNRVQSDEESATRMNWNMGKVVSEVGRI